MHLARVVSDLLVNLVGVGGLLNPPDLVLQPVQLLGQMCV